MFVSAIAAVAAIFAWTEAREANDLADTANDQSQEANGLAADANSSAEEANRLSTESLDLAKNNEARLDRQEASKVYLGEIPTELYARHPRPPGERIWMAVINATGAKVENAWVADEAGRSITIEGIQRCHLYALEPGFAPKDLYFSDANGMYWHRHEEEQVEQVPAEEFPLPPKPDTGGDSPWDAPVEGC